MHRNGNLPSLRTICSAETKDFFLVAAKKPFEEDSEAFKILDSPAREVRELQEGSQVFVYRKELFGNRPEYQEARLMEHLSSVAEQVGGVAVYPNIRLLEGSNG